MKRIAIATLALFLSATLCAGRLSAAEGSPVQEWAVLPLLPAETLVAVSCKDVKKAYEHLQQTGLWKFANAPDVQNAFKGPLLHVRGAMVMTEQKLGARFKDLFESVQGEFTFGLLGFLAERNEHGEPIPDLFLAFQPREKTQAWMDLWQRFVDRLVQQTENQLQISQFKAAGTEIITLSVPGVPVQVQYALADGTFLAGIGQGRIEKLLAMRQLAQAKGGADPDLKTLSTQPAFQRAVEKAGPASEALLYVNVEALRKSRDAKFNPVTEREKLDWDLAGLSGVKAAAYSLGFKDGGLAETLFVACPPKDRTGVWALLDGPALPQEVLLQAPRNTLGAVALQAPPDQLLERLLEMGKLSDPAEHQQTLAALEKANAALNLDLRKDVLSAFTGQALLTLVVPAPHAKVGWCFPRPLLTLGVKDPAAAARALEALRRAGGEQWDFSDLVHREYRIVAGRERRHEGRDPGVICWALDQERLLLSLYPIALREELDRLHPETAAAGSKGALTAGGLAGDPDFQNVSAHVGPAPRAACYLDTGALAAGLYDFFIPLGQISGKGPPWLDMGALPATGSIARHLGGMYLALGCDADGLKIEGYSSTGLFSTLLPAAAIVGERIKRRREGAAPAAEPALNEQRAALSKALGNLGQALNAYARTHGGAFPAGLNELVPQFVKEQEAKGLEEISYLGKREAPNRVIAYFSNTPANGPLPVLLQDASVRMVAEGQLSKVLQEGFTAADTAREGEAVKPPHAPPDF